MSASAPTRVRLPALPTRRGTRRPPPDDAPAGAPRSRVGVVAGHAVLVVLSVISLFPIYWMYATALRRPADAYSLNVIPWPMSLDNVRTVHQDLAIGGLLLNTAVVAALTAAGQLLTSLFAAYAFTAWKFRGRGLLFLLFVGTWLIPFQVTMMPNYVLLSQLGLLNTLAGVVIPTVASTMAVLMLRQHMQAFPTELLDAARVDGRRAWGRLWTVLVPNLRPALASLGILLFISAWNEYFWPALVLRRANSVVQLGLRSFLGAEGDAWGPLMAASGLACLPIFVVYLVLQRHVVDAFVRSGLR